MQRQPASGGSEPASDSRQRQPASGGSEAAFGCSTQLYMRVAKVFSLMDLFTARGSPSLRRHHRSTVGAAVMKTLQAIRGRRLVKEK